MVDIYIIAYLLYRQGIYDSVIRTVYLVQRK